MKYNSDFYDDMFKDGGYSGVFDLPVKRSHYYPLYKSVLKEINRLNKPLIILEVGSGTGGMAELILRQGIEYKGFDFSGVAIE